MDRSEGTRRKSTTLPRKHMNETKQPRNPTSTTKSKRDYFSLRERTPQIYSQDHSSTTTVRLYSLHTNDSIDRTRLSVCCVRKHRTGNRYTLVHRCTVPGCSTALSQTHCYSHTAHTHAQREARVRYSLQTVEYYDKLHGRKADAATPHASSTPNGAGDSPRSSSGELPELFAFLRVRIFVRSRMAVSA